MITVFTVMLCVSGDVSEDCAMLLSASFVIQALLLGTLVYLLCRLAVFIADVRRRGRAIEQFPGEPKHWLWGHIHLVLTYASFLQLIFC